ncbi:MAG: alpha/beta hydrolase [Mycobacterium sp.]
MTIWHRLAAREFHPELRRYSRYLPRTLVTPLTVTVFRRLPRRAKCRPGTSVHVLPSGIGVRVHRPPEQRQDRGGALLWIHGGGYVLGNAAMDDTLCRGMAAELDIPVCAVDYRLAPEHPYPAALDDCYEALCWLAAQPGVDGSRLAVAGASAGGGLAAALALWVRDRGDFPVAAQVLIYPMLDDRGASGEDPEAGLRRLWNAASSALGWRAYLGGSDPVTAVPARCGDLSGLAPTWIGVGSLDVLHGEACAYAERLREAGVECHLEVVPGGFHGFDAVAPKTLVAKQFFASQITMIRNLLDIGGPPGDT